MQLVCSEGCVGITSWRKQYVTCYRTKANVILSSPVLAGVLKNQAECCQVQKFVHTYILCRWFRGWKAACTAACNTPRQHSTALEIVSSTGARSVVLLQSVCHQALVSSKFSHLWLFFKKFLVKIFVVQYCIIYSVLWNYSMEYIVLHVTALTTHTIPGFSHGQWNWQMSNVNSNKENLNSCGSPWERLSLLCISPEPQQL